MDHRPEHLAQDYIQGYIGRRRCTGQPVTTGRIANLIQHLGARVARQAALTWLATHEPALAQQLRLVFPELVPKARVRRYTTAPEAYDSFGTETVRTHGRLNGQVLRLVDIAPEHVEWQCGRYESGLYPTFTEHEMAVMRKEEWFHRAQAEEEDARHEPQQIDRPL